MHVPALHEPFPAFRSLLAGGVVMRCSYWRRLPPDLRREAQERSADVCVDSVVQCQLSAHEDGEHYGLVGDPGAYGTALWVRWKVMTAVDLVALRDCPATAPGPDGDGCCLFAGHGEQHTWEGASEKAPRSG
ncbi:hypothetical protein [Streptomyces sp. NBC_00101]|uniref:hypothetical protein n=1 Tax=Streptomyces sp. NBC_00101 TaxID=2975651 RepID=UPI00386951CD